MTQMIFVTLKKFGNLAFGPDISAEYVIYHFWYILSGFLRRTCLEENFEIFFFLNRSILKFKHERNHFDARGLLL